MFCVYDERWLQADFAGIKIGVALQMFLLAPPTLTFSHQPSVTVGHMAPLKHTTLHHPRYINTRDNCLDGRP